MDLSDYTSEDIRNEIEAILRPNLDGRCTFSGPSAQLSTDFGLDLSYCQTCEDPARKDEYHLTDPGDALHLTLESISVPVSMMGAALSLFGESIATYHRATPRWDVYRFYPPLLMTAWAAFESWVRINSEILIAVSSSLPVPVQEALKEARFSVAENGKIKEKQDRRPVLERFRLLLKYGCAYEVDQGSKAWQQASLAMKARDGLVHYKTNEAPALRATEIWEHLQSILLLWIAPSCAIGRTLWRHQYDFHNLLLALETYMAEFEERPLNKDWPKEHLVFHCPFDGVDVNRYPNRSAFLSRAAALHRSG